jgi:hypothetical protein
MIGMHGSNAPSPQPDRMQVDSTTTALAMPWLGQQSGGRRPITTSGGTVPGSAPRDPVWRLWEDPWLIGQGGFQLSCGCSLHEVCD